MEPLNLASLQPGIAIRLKDGSVKVIVENPGDGTWLFCRPLGNDDAPEEPIFAQDVIGLAESTG
ncbi:MAG: hypothetical protein JSR61_17400 [Proteobacteria bacterium]|nr:hypothetical protein [Pseudomonadota bacterium]